MYFMNAFFKRHKKSIILAGFILSSGYLTGKWCCKIFKENYLVRSKNSFYAIRKLEHYLTIQQTSDEATLSLLKSLDEAIRSYIQTENLLDHLKTRPNNKLEIWQKLKIKCITKLITAIYSISILIIYVKVVLNIIGGCMYTNNINIKNKNGTDHGIQQKFLENIELFIKSGLPKLCNIVEKIMENKFSSVTLKENLTVDFLRAKFETAFVDMEFLHKQNLKNNDYLNIELDDCKIESQNFNFMTVYLFHDFYLKESIHPYDKNVTLYKLNIEALDLISSSDFLKTFEELKFVLFSSIFTHLSFEIIQQNNKKDHSIPFAKLIPIIDKCFDKLFNLESSTLINDLLSNKMLNSFGANIYESFSYSDEDELL